MTPLRRIVRITTVPRPRSLPKTAYQTTPRPSATAALGVRRFVIVCSLLSINVERLQPLDRTLRLPRSTH